MTKRRRAKPAPVKVAANDPLGRFRAMFVHRGVQLIQIEQLGPRVPASTPEELESATSEALTELTKNLRPN